RTVLCAEIPCGQGDAIWTATPDTLSNVVTDTIAALGLPPVRVASVEVRRLPVAYPVYRTGFEAPMEVVTAWAGDQPRLRSFGRLGLFAHDNTHHALLEARLAVDTIDDSDGWQHALASFATHVVED